jgi:hypothetical protein|eukprot:COSAG06_NODE_4923_length_3856_cov_3.048177_7_plen_453_part_00
MAPLAPAPAPAPLRPRKSLSQVLQRTGCLPEAAIAHVLAQLLRRIVDSSDAFCDFDTSGVLLAEETAAVQELAAPDGRSSGSAAGTASPPSSQFVYPTRFERRCQADGTLAVATPADVAWAVGALAAECSIGVRQDGAPLNAPATAKRLQQSGQFSPAFLDFVSACLHTTAARRTLPAALLKHELFEQHAGAATWLRKDGRLQLKVSEAIAEAGSRYLYSALRDNRLDTVESFLTDQSEVVIGTAAASSPAAAADALRRQPLRGCAVEEMIAEPARRTSEAVASGAQPSWVVTVSGLSAGGGGSRFSHRLTVGIAATSVDELVVERWEIPQGATAAAAAAAAGTPALTAGVSGGMAVGAAQRAAELRMQSAALRKDNPPVTGAASTSAASSYSSSSSSSSSSLLRPRASAWPEGQSRFATKLLFLWEFSCGRVNTCAWYSASSSSCRFDRDD